jgi:hypothetical protein
MGFEGLIRTSCFLSGVRQFHYRSYAVSRFPGWNLYPRLVDTLATVKAGAELPHSKGNTIRAFQKASKTFSPYFRLRVDAL